MLDLKKRTRELAEMLRLARRVYHSSTHRPVLDRAGTVFKPISDAEYDAYEEELRAIAPDHPLFAQVGSEPVFGEKVKLPHPMGSLGKIKPDGSALKWLRAIGKTPICVSNKLDGISAEIIYDKARDEFVMYSRGNGIEGVDISPLLCAIPDAVLTAKQCVRGELVIAEADFEVWSGEFANTRNLVAGIANAAGQSGRLHRAASAVRFVAHGQLYPACTLYDADLEADGWDVVPHAVYHFWKYEDPEAELIKILKERRAESPYAIDGLVLETNTGEQIAFKGVDREAIVEVGYVDWRVGRHGDYKPVAMLKDPVQLDGVTVVKATAHNAKFLINHSIGPGARIRIVRSGGVIPKIVGTVTPAEVQYPPSGTYAWNETEVNFRVTRATAASRHEMSQRSLVHAASCLGIDGIQGGTASKLVAGGFDSPLALLQRGTTELFRGCGLGPVAANNLAADIAHVLETTNHHAMMNASGVFPHGWGSTRLWSVLQYYTWAELAIIAADLDPEAFYAEVGAIEGFEWRLCGQLQDGVIAYAAWLAELGWTTTRTLPEYTAPSGPLAGEEVCFTKVRDRVLQAKIVELGGAVCDRVGGATRWLVAPPGASSTKVTAATKRGVPVITVVELAAELAKLEA